MRHRVAYSGMIGLILVTMLTMTAIARDDEVPDNGAFRAHVLGNLNLTGVSNPKNVDMESARGSVVLLLHAGKTAIHIAQGYDFAVLDKKRADGRAESLRSDAGIDPFITGVPGAAGRETELPFEAP